VTRILPANPERHGHQIKNRTPK